MTNLDEWLQVGPMVRDAAEKIAAALIAEGRLRQLPALSLDADEVLDGTLDVRKEHFVELCVACDLLERPHFDAWRVHVENKVGNAAMLRYGRVGARQEYREIGQMSLAGPHLLAVDQIVVAVLEALLFGTCAQPGQVRSSVGLCIQLAPDLFGVEDLGN